MTGLPEAVASYLRIRARQGELLARSLLDEYAPAPEWQIGDVVRIAGVAWMRTRDGIWTTPTDPAGTFTDDGVDRSSPVLLVRDGKVVTS